MALMLTSSSPAILRFVSPSAASRAATCSVGVSVARVSLRIRRGSSPSRSRMLRTRLWSGKRSSRQA